jgi:hypothetical protein
MQRAQDRDAVLIDSAGVTAQIGNYSNSHVRSGASPQP